MMLKNYTNPAKRHGSFVFWLNAVLIMGIALGSFFGNPYNISSPLVNQFFSPVYSGNTPVEVFSNTFMSLFFFVLTAFLSGMSAIGQPVGILLLLYRGFGIGISTMSLYCQKGLSAVPAVVTLVLPKAIFSSAVSVLAVRELLRLSCRVMKFVTSGESTVSEEKSFRLYCVKFAVLCGMCVAISVADAVANYLFAGFV